MGDINRTAFFYRKKFAGKEAKFNVPAKLPDYFAPMIGDKKEVVIAELGAGPVNTIGNEWPGVQVTIYASDVLWPEYKKYWKHHNKYPIVPIEYQDMEHLTYPDNFFDIVHCVNAVDHTPNLYQAIKEMKRVCKLGGWLYLRHSPGQKTRYGGMHYWDYETVEMQEFMRTIESDQIVDVWKKI
jgi:SAM-dependent methyltransferase